MVQQLKTHAALTEDLRLACNVHLRRLTINRKSKTTGINRKFSWNEHISLS